MTIVSASMPEGLRDDLDEFADRHGYSGRSEVIREACQRLLESARPAAGADRRVLATVTAVFPYDTPAVERQMMAVRHGFEDAIRSNSHECLDERAGCVETFVVEADEGEVREFVATVRAVDEGVTVEHASVPVDVLTAETGRPEE